MDLPRGPLVKNSGLGTYFCSTKPIWVSNIRETDLTSSNTLELREPGEPHPLKNSLVPNTTNNKLTLKIKKRIRYSSKLKVRPPWKIEIETGK